MVMESRRLEGVMADRRHGVVPYRARYERMIKEQIASKLRERRRKDSAAEDRAAKTKGIEVHVPVDFSGLQLIKTISEQLSRMEKQLDTLIEYSSEEKAFHDSILRRERRTHDDGRV